MRIRQNILLIWLFAAVLPAMALALENRVVRRPVGSATVPPTSRRSGLIRSPNPIDTSSNLVVTGNVSGGRHFRGVVPYNSASNFYGTTGTESVESFLRYSGGAEYYGNYSGSTTPYYSPSKTVTTTISGGGVSSPPTMYRDYRQEAAQLAVSQQSKEAIARPEMFVRPGLSKEAARMYRTDRPMSMSLEEMEKLIDSEGEIAFREKQQQERAQQFEAALKQASDRAAELERKLNYKSDALRQVPQQASEPAGPESASSYNQQASVSQRGTQDIYEQMKEQLSIQPKEPEEAVGLQQAAESTEKSKVGEEGQDNEGASKPANLFEDLTREELASKARGILGEYKTFASFSRDKFNRYMLAGETYLREGKFYLAADAYTLASVYKPEDPLAYAGKSHALFAAGEYMSSALYLSRAITIFPDYTRFKVDIIVMVGDRDKLETRIADVQEWLKRSEAGELDFLLAYVYYQMNRPGEAKKSIDAAYEKMPGASAVKILQEAINEAVK